MFNLPNMLTATNLFFGCCALVSLNKGNVNETIFFILLAAVVDFLDGFAARMMKQESALGVQLDSLCDVVSFGVVPAMICFHIMQSITAEPNLISYLAFFLALAAAFRLARFNVQSTGKDLFFTGLPVPANALFFCGMLYLNNSDFSFKSIFINQISFLLIIFLFSYLMISHWKILKIHLSKEWLDKYAFVLIIEIISLGSIYWIGATALSLVILIHILCSLFLNFNKSKTHTT
jgi:CDP-diacylglycerol--serine O-phosphatidyltransferase